LEEQFSSFTYLKGDGHLYTNAELIKQCLSIGSNDYPWLEPLLQILSESHQQPGEASSSKSKVFEIRMDDFINFLETGTLQLQPSGEASNKPPPGVRKKVGGLETPPRRNNSLGDFSTSSNTASPNGKSKQLPPVAPAALDVGGRQSSRSKLLEVMEIDLSKGKVPEGIKIKSSNQESVDGDNEKFEGKEDEETLEIIVRPTPNSRLASSIPGGPKVMEGNGKQLWRKREIVRQERTVHYTTVDEAGEMQELVEKETTQTEILHMECRDTGEFAHKETTQYEQVETFNEDLVNEVRGHEEYVHLKSLEDEFHYMDSNMPPKGDPQKERHEAEERERQRREHEEARAGEEHHQCGPDGYPLEEVPDPNSPGKKSSGANGSYVFEAADEKEGGNRPTDWTAEEEEAYRQYCADYKQGEFQFPSSVAEDPIVTHCDDDEKVDEKNELFPPKVSIPGAKGAEPEPVTQDSCDTGGYAVVSSENTIQEDESPTKPAYSSMHDID
jgi:hypothetical protein